MIVCFIERANGSAAWPGLEGPFRDGLRVPEALESRTVVWLGCKTRFFNSADDYIFFFGTTLNIARISFLPGPTLV